MTGEHVAVIGGSVAGCAAALALRQAGIDVTVFERTSDGLQDRGVGIGMQSDLYRELESAGYLDASVPYLPMATRKWITRDEGANGGRVIGVMDFDARTYNWGLLWQALRDRVPDTVEYRAGCRVASVLDGGDKVTVALADGSEERFDAVLGADGYRSTVRAAMFPDTRPEYAGYLLWRGTLPAADHADLFQDNETVYVGYPGGHLVTYLIPGRDGRPIVNWGAYSTPPPGLAPRWDDPTSQPPAELLDHLAVIGESLPPHWREVIQATPVERMLTQPIYDVITPALAAGRLALIGDAAAVARPHTGAGAVKALQDAVALRSILGEGIGLPEALRVFDQQRGPMHRLLVGLGRELGRVLVLETPDWARLDATGLDEWWDAAIARGVRG